MRNETFVWEMKDVSGKKKFGEVLCGKGKKIWGERVKKMVRCGKSCVGRIKKGVNTLLVSTFWGHFYFGPYFSILLLLVPKMKNVFYFGSYRYLTNGNCLHGKRSTLFTH